jgi:predicted O-linked N-acetylglucosamine transferase (SPINDLY family)
VNALPCRETGFVTFGCLNNFCKVNDAVLSLWARVLNALPGSRLTVMVPQGSARQSVLDRLGRDGIGCERVDFAAKQPRIDYLRTYHQIDIALDTLPYNGHTTSLDSLWMGVPVVTLVGRTVVGRAGLSQLSNLNLTELAARTDDQFVRVAADLAADMPRLAELRRTLRGRMRASPLMDAASFARDVEAAYRWMWRTWCGNNGGGSV